MRRLDLFDSSRFDRGVGRIREICWQMCRLVFFAHSVPIPSALKAVLLRWFGARIGHGVVIRSRVTITFPWRFQCGDHVWIGDDVLILSLAEVRLGSHVCVSQRAFLCTGSHDLVSPGFNLITKPITIGDGCWVAAQSFIAPGVTLGPNTVCAAGSVVVKAAGPDELIGGNPARRIRLLAEYR